MQAAWGHFQFFFLFVFSCLKQVPIYFSYLVLFCCGAPEMFHGLRNFDLISEQIMTRFKFLGVNCSFNFQLQYQTLCNWNAVAHVIYLTANKQSGFRSSWIHIYPTLHRPHTLPSSVLRRSRCGRWEAPPGCFDWGRSERLSHSQTADKQRGRQQQLFTGVSFQR